MINNQQTTPRRQHTTGNRQQTTHDNKHAGTISNISNLSNKMRCVCFAPCAVEANALRRALWQLVGQELVVSLDAPDP
eukprot:11168242-Lingulodinium_polyedra.AAC.1